MVKVYYNELTDALELAEDIGGAYIHSVDGICWFTVNPRCLSSKFLTYIGVL